MNAEKDPTLGVKVTCHECGATEETHWSRELNERLIREHLCFTCDFWLEKVQWAKEGKPNCLRIDGHHYFANPKHEGPFRGFGGILFTYRFKGETTVHETNDLWHQGGIPKHFKARLPDNAEFIYGPKGGTYGNPIL